MRIQILFEHGTDLVPYGCSYIRLLLPLSYQSEADSFKVTKATEFDQGKSDVYIFERLWKPGLTLSEAESVIRRIKKQNKILIYTLDDNLLDLNVMIQGQVFPTPEQKNIIRLFAKEAHGIIVSTSPLKERLSKFNQNIYVVANSIDERLLRNHDFSSNADQQDNIVVGYMGTPSHESDLLMIMTSVREVLQKYKSQIKLQLVGILADQSIMELFKDLPVEVLDVTGNVEYPKFMKWMQQNIKWDFAIAPLEDSIFAKSKSDIKFLDYSILKIPGIYSKVKPYEDTIIHKQNGYLVNNNHEEWVNALEEMISDEKLRNKISNDAYNYVNTKRILRYCHENWIESIKSILQTAR